MKLKVGGLSLNYDLTLLLRKVFDVLLVKNPIGTGLGVLLGIALQGLVGLFTPTLKTILYLDFSRLTYLHYISFSVFSFNIKTFLSKDKVDPSIERIFDFIKESEKDGKIDKETAHKYYNQLCSEIVSRVVIESDGFNEKADVDVNNG
ncbi:hypothetical protein [Marinobacterium stanieri]|uniref:Uncharacterized protein n=1 Tax=Marinobacterium stanieri TaxID=49186 RepID=A0A1N6PDI7_9GAMM|nr:hypothetical protein [Marinobacterium stanieri]SIQ02296.1 hypothetical protein SAMN05421647_101958 [Marinobacterium stanieri]